MKDTMKTAEQIATLHAEQFRDITDPRGGDLYPEIRREIQAAIEADRAQYAAIKIRTDDWNNAYLTEGDRVLFMFEDGDTLRDLNDVARDSTARSGASFAEVGLPTGGVV